jgi:hypothetical protein
MAAYEKYFSGQLKNFEVDEKEIENNTNKLEKLAK